MTLYTVHAWCSSATDPRLLIFFLVPAVAYTGAGTWSAAVGWSLWVLAVAVSPVLAAYSHLEQAPARPERVVIYRVSLYSTGCTLLGCIAVGAPHVLTALVASIMVAAAAGCIVTPYLKVSVHTGCVAIAVTSAISLWGGYSVLSALLVPFVGWLRIRGGYHSLKETIAGGVGATAITVAVTALCAGMLG